MNIKTITAVAVLASAALAATGAQAITLQGFGNAPSPQPEAASATVGFPSSGTFYFSATNGTGFIPAGGMSAFMWTTGDYVSQTFAEPGLPNVSSLNVNFQFNDVLGSGNNETVYLLINSTPVAQFIAPDCSYCGTNYTVSGALNFAGIAPIAGGYTLEMQLQNTIPSGGGSIAFNDGGTWILGAAGTPEPATWAMMLAGFGLAGAALRTSRRAPQAV
ncbi:MAG: PEPxxWA-CTERM sorting domain-containing protein [Caulobacteraceae bacterium]